MDCAQNDFCKTLPKGTRNALCPVCRKRFLKAGSIQPPEDFSQNCTMILDGMVVSTTDLSSDVVDHSSDMPVLYLGLPGRLTGLEGVFEFDASSYVLSYLDLKFLTDSWVASFRKEDVKDLYDKDSAFRQAVSKNMLLTTADALQCMALFRANYTYHGLFHLLRILANCKQFLTHQQLADIMNHDRTSISKAVSRIKAEHPDIWAAYAKNKGRIPSRPIPQNQKQGS